MSLVADSDIRLTVIWPTICVVSRIAHRIVLVWLLLLEFETSFRHVFPRSAGLLTELFSPDCFYLSSKFATFFRGQQDCSPISSASSTANRFSFAI